ncbi:MAG TPA: HprK-related kinase B [Atribacteraceae bacterium]|nr:HprK-related kinase B [Atribacteraceae bacterium]
MDNLFDSGILGAAVRVLERFPPRESLTLLFGDSRIRVTSNDPNLIAALRRYYRVFTAVSSNNINIEVMALEGPTIDPGKGLVVKPPDPGKMKIKEEYREIPGGRVVRKRLTGMIFVFGSGVNLAIGPCLTNANQVINFINSRYIQWMLDRGCLLFHAAGVCQGRTGLALAGFAGRGKSTLALRLVRKGWRFVSNDRLLVKKGEGRKTMYGVAKLPRVNPGTLLADPALHGVLSEGDRRRYAEVPALRLWDLEHKHDVYLDEVFGEETFVLCAPLSALVLLNWKKDIGMPCFRLVDLRERNDLMRSFVKSPGLFYQPDPNHPLPDFSVERYLEVLNGSPVFEVTGGIDFNEAARFVASLQNG